MSVPAPDPDPRLPTVDDVAAIIRARTQDSHDDEIGTFNDDTRPTGVEVEKLIDNAAGVVYSRLGDMSDEMLVCPTADDLQDQARYMVSMLAAMLVELSYFPEQIEANRSAFEHYKELWDDQMTTLIDAAAECRAGEVTPDTEDGGYIGKASWAFPVDTGGLVGWRTKW